MKNRTIKKIIYGLLVLAVFGACSDQLDVEPKNKVPAQAVLSDPEGVKGFVANLYYSLPVEDLVYFPRAGFNARGNTGSLSLSQYALEAIHSEWPNWNEFSSQAWDNGYRLNRDLNTLTDILPSVKMTDSEKDALYGEIAFMRAYIYFGMAKRYGGVPIIAETQEYTSDFESLRVPRSSEKETWDFILAQLDEAIAKLPEARAGVDETKRRATKWAAYALKSEVALHAASVAKYWNLAPVSGDAVDRGFVGLAASEANRYYALCIQASEAVMNSGVFGLYQPTPATPEEAAKNYQALFMNPNNALTEVIFMKGYGFAGGPLAHDYDGWNNPNQNAEGFPYRGRTNPVLELVDLYESYDNPGTAAPIITTTDGQVHEGDFDATLAYKTFDEPDGIFAGKDARFFATVIYPGTTWKGTEIVIQGGIIKPDGTVVNSQTSVEHNGVTYYTFGGQTSGQYSGFDGSANATRSGFLLRKFLNEDAHINTWKQSTTDFVDLRYAEVLLNYAEAVVESGYAADGAPERAAEALNDIRRRAGHSVDIPLTLENVLRERAVELSFENKGYWDLVRRRTFHTTFNNFTKTALVPMLDLRGAEPKYIFIRKKVPGANPNTFFEGDYYKGIPGTNNNGLIQNP